MKRLIRQTTKARRLAAALCLTCATSFVAATIPPESGGKYLGGLTPSEALEYMKQTPNLCIIDVREAEWYEGHTQFTGNMHIPRSQLAERCKEIPSDRPVILNCGAGVQAPRAYNFLKEQNADIRQLSYIAGTPLFKEYNEWVAVRKETDKQNP